jgi:hypothetical protein
MKVRSLRLLPASLCRALERETLALCEAWCRDWGVPDGAVAVGAAPPAAGPAGGGAAWRQGRRNGAAALWMDWDGGFASQVQGLMFASDARAGALAVHPAVVAPALAAAATDALIAALGERLLGAAAATPCLPGEQPDAEWLPMSGALVVSVRLGGEVLSCLLNDAAVQGWGTQGASGGSAAAAPPLAPVEVRGALAPVPVALPVAFQAVDVDLGNLLTAAVGDVIRLGAALDAPLQLQAPDGRNLLPAYLGRIGDSIAIEIAPR